MSVGVLVRALGEVSIACLPGARIGSRGAPNPIHIISQTDTSSHVASFSAAMSSWVDPGCGSEKLEQVDQPASFADQPA